MTFVFYWLMYQLEFCREIELIEKEVIYISGGLKKSVVCYFIKVLEAYQDWGIVFKSNDMQKRQMEIRIYGGL